MKVVQKLNDHQIKAIANLLLEIGKWLLLVVVFSAIFIQSETTVEIYRFIGALIYAFLLIVIAILLLKEVKKDG